MIFFKGKDTADGQFEPLAPIWHVSIKFRWLVPGCCPFFFFSIGRRWVPLGRINCRRLGSRCWLAPCVTMATINGVNWRPPGGLVENGQHANSFWWLAACATLWHLKFNCQIIERSHLMNLIAVWVKSHRGDLVTWQPLHQSLWFFFVLSGPLFHRVTWMMAFWPNRNSANDAAPAGRLWRRNRNLATSDSVSPIGRRPFTSQPPRSVFFNQRVSIVRLTPFRLI